MSYVNLSHIQAVITRIIEYSLLQEEQGSGDLVKPFVEKLEQTANSVLESVMNIAPDPMLATREPNDYEAIRALCEGGNKAAKVIPDLAERMAGAVLGRFAGCTLGVPVEGWTIPDMQTLAKYASMEFPPKDYWTVVERPWGIQYGIDSRWKYTKEGMDGVPVDDDITYTLLGLLIVEKYGFDFTTNDVGEFWLARLPYACTAEDVALHNLKMGVPALQAAEINNPYYEWIGADIRADGFAFAAAGDPQLAASMGYRDAYLSHRRNGIYGEMFFAAAEAAAFCVDTPEEALRIAMREIPTTCALYKDLEWAFSIADSIKDYEHARHVVDERFGAMSQVHTNNNACLTVIGLLMGKGDFSKTIADVVAMGRDNDCTAATAGSILGAIVGKKGIAAHWTAPFHDKVRTYIVDAPEFSIEDVIGRFVQLAQGRMNKDINLH